MSDTTKKYPSLADVFRDVDLFLKIDAGMDFTLADFPTIAEGRWQYLSDNWDFLKTNLLIKVDSLPDMKTKVESKKQILEFTALIEGNRASPQNPLANRSNFRKFADLLSNMLVNDIELTVLEQSLINREIDRINNLEKEDFYEMRKRVRITHDKVADGLGLGDETYNRMLERVGAQKILTFKFEDYNILSSLVTTYNQITSLMPMEIVRNENPDPFLIIRNALNNPDISMNSYLSGIVVPFPAGGTLEMLSSKYLGTPDRALEIAVANGLQFPYIDEIGRKVPLIINGVGNIVIVSLAESSSFFINQEISVGSNKERIAKRKILDIMEDKNNEQVILTLSGERDLSRYTLVHQAFILVFAKYTINSDSFIMIPSLDGVGFQVNSIEPWFVKELPNDVKDMGVDLALGPNDDIVFSDSGDLLLSYGLANAAQALSLKMKIKSGELIRNKTFGLIEEIGKINNEEISDSILYTMIESAIGNDDRFGGIDGFGYTITDTGIFINATVKISGVDNSIPLTFHLPKG